MDILKYLYVVTINEIHFTSMYICKYLIFKYITILRIIAD